MKSWVIFTQNAILLHCSILFIENLTFPRLPLHFLSDWPPNPNPKKEKMWKVSLYLIFPPSSVFYLRDTCFDLLHFFFLIIWKDLWELLLVFVIFAPRQKKMAKRQQKRYNLMIESLLPSNTSNRLKFIVTPTCGKTRWPPSQKWNYDS